MRKWFGLLVWLALCAARPTLAEEGVARLTLNSLFTDNMVLQRDKEAPVWGNAPAGEKISVTLNGKTAAAVADKAGKWLARLPAQAAGGPHVLSVAGAGEKSEIKNVMLGDVWICSGQSNMQFHVKNVNNSESEIANANYPEIRHYVVKYTASGNPLAEPSGKWLACNPKSVSWFSAVGYFFGRETHKSQKVAVGLINVAIGSTCAETWSSEKALLSDPEFKPVLDRFAEAVKVFPEKQKEYEQKLAEWKKAKQKRDNDPNAPDPGKQPDLPMGDKNQNAPSRLYNGMVNPLLPFGIKGAIWYQGEGNVHRAFIYRKLLGAMVKSWREGFAQGDFPFLVVQLANYRAVQKQPGESNLAELREAQALCCKDVPNMGLALAIDVGDAKDIHPKDKQTVGARLALAARALAYGEKIVCSGPVYKSMKVEGDSIRLSFDCVGGGLVAKNGELKAFAIAGEDKKFIWAEAKVDGSDVVVKAAGVAKPVAVRYAWADNPEGCNLYNAEGLPAVPFRTDEWPGITINAR